MPASPLSSRLRQLPRVTFLGREVPVATDLRARLLGLAHLDLDEAGEGLLIPACSSVHTFGMRFALDVVFIAASVHPLSLHRRTAQRPLTPERDALLCERALDPEAGTRMIRVYHDVPPRRFVSCRGATAVFEAPAER
jgi:hypothetical protein